MSKHLVFNSKIGSQKPNSLLNSDADCPFCDRDNLTDLLETEGSIIWLKNKYPTLEDTYQTVIIETDECHSELSEYNKDHLYRVISFGLKHWKNLIHSKRYESVLLFKNHGPYSGGSLRHPHMQIVGLEKMNYLKSMSDEHFNGIQIEHKNGIEYNISKYPRMGFFEFNVIMENHDNIESFADNIQISAHYILNHFNKNCNSYNLFFYELGEKIAVKIMPRFSTSPLFVGYSIPQVSNRIEDVVKKIKTIYF
ncbi:DUF4931 domain-containing protein [Calidifontibacillus oryziterrae]|uniref:DUF4931 domain-containing protein n=1 Tax=Calidifontibacillus oryziterrae TaxID=1191699 RepID=UPI0003711366|nr:DUF4931 domain-containing protein [Calidifontibacillus oryziterrae]